VSSILILLLPGPIWIWPVIFGVAIVFWLKKCFVVVGTAVNSRGERITVTGLLIAFNKPVKACGPGIYFHWWPIERFKFFPTSQYTLPYIFENVYSKAEGSESTQTMTVEVTLYFHWPRVEEVYHFPARAATSARGGAPSEEEIDSIPWEVKDAFFLLSKAHFGFPYDPMKVTAEQLREFFRGEMHDAVHTVCGKYTHTVLRNQKEIPKERINRRILVQEGPFYEIGSAWECTEVALVFRLPGDTEEALRTPEIATNRAEATVREARGKARAAKQERVVLAARLEALMSQPGTSPLLAQILAVDGARGEGMDMAEFRDFALAQSLIGRKPTFEDILSALDKLSPGQIEELKRRLNL